jgi:hypothetical protein
MVVELTSRQNHYYNYNQFEATLENILLSYFYKIIFPYIDSKPISLSALEAKIGITGPYHNYFCYLLELLQQDKFISIDASIKLKPLKPPLEQDQKLQQLHNSFANFSGIIIIFEQLLNQILPILQGKLYAVAALYPNGSTDFLEKNLDSDYNKISNFTSIKAEFISLFSKQLRAEKKPAKIIEIGGGAGNLTWDLIDNLLAHHISFEYHFTDIGRKFILSTEKKAKEKLLSNFIAFQYDILKNPSEQNLPLHSYDALIGLNVLHLAPNLTSTIKFLISLLKKDGILFLIESIYSPRWLNLLLGLLPGWWVKSKIKRISGGPLLIFEQWNQLLRGVGLKEILSFTNNNGALADTALFAWKRTHKE